MALRLPLLYFCDNPRYKTLVPLFGDLSISDIRVILSGKDSYLCTEQVERSLRLKLVRLLCMDKNELTDLLNPDNQTYEWLECVSDLDEIFQFLDNVCTKQHVKHVFIHVDSRARLNEFIAKCCTIGLGQATLHVRGRLRKRACFANFIETDCANEPLFC